MFQFQRKQPPRQTLSLGQLIENVFTDLHPCLPGGKDPEVIRKVLYNAFRHGFVGALGQRTLDEAIAIYPGFASVAEDIQTQMIFQGFAMGCAIAEHKQPTNVSQ